MKRIFVLQLFILFIFSATSFSQPVPGGSSDGSPVNGKFSSSQNPCPVSFVKNIITKGKIEIRVNYNQLPANAPELVSILSNSSRVHGIILPVKANVDKSKTKKYLSYFISAKITASQKLTLYFKYPGSDQEDCVLNE